MVEIAPIPRMSWLPALNEVGWDLVADRIVHGLSHDLTGRASSLSGLIFLIEAEGNGVSQAVKLLGGELEQLEATVALFRYLPDDSAGVELLAPSELVPELIRLVNVQRGLENVAIDFESSSDAPGVWIDRTLFVRALLLLLTGAAEGAVVSGQGRIRLLASRGEEGLVLEFAPLFPAGGGPSTDPGILPRQIVAADRLRGVLEILVGEGIRTEEVGEDEGPAGLRLYFPPSSSA